MRHPRLPRIAILTLLFAIALVRDGAFGRWTADVTGGAVVSDAAGDQTIPLAVSDGAGGMIIVWEDTRSGNKDVYAQRLDAAGAPVWTADGLAICSAAGDQTNPRITGDGSGGAIIAWQDARGADIDIYAQRVASIGVVQWAADGVTVSSVALAQENPQIAPDGSGGAIVVWQDFRNGTDDEVYAQRMDATGVPQWAANGVNITASAGNQRNPQVDDDGNGGAFVAWEDARGGNLDVYVQYVTSGGVAQWVGGLAAETASPAGDQDTIRMIADATGTVLVWEDARNGATGTDVYAQRITVNGGRAWGDTAKVVCQNSGEQINPRLAALGAGGYVFVWQDNRLGTQDIYAQRLDSAGTAQWTLNGISYCGAAGDQTNPRIEADGSSAVTIVWQDARSGSDIYGQRVSAAGAAVWTADGLAVNTASGSQERPVIVFDSTTGAMIAWQDQRGGNYDIYAQRVRANGTMGNNWPTTTDTNLALCTQAGNQTNPCVVGDGREGAIVAWQDARNSATTGIDIYAQRVNAVGDIQWTADGVAVSAQTGSEMNPQTAADGTGGAIFVWQDFRNGADFDIYAIRISALGTPAAEIALCVKAGNQINPRIVAAGTAGAVILWQDDSGASKDLYVAGIDGTDAITFGQDGATPICSANGDQENAQMIGDGAGGVVAVWQDYRSGTSLDIYAQRVNAAGVAAWTSNGVAVCVDPANQTAPKIVTDGAAGGIIVWTDQRAGNSDIYAHHIQGNGTLAAAWMGVANNGIPLCNDTANQTNPSACLDRSSGVIVAWLDDRGSSSDVYAVRFDGNGAIVAGWTANGSPVCVNSAAQNFVHVADAGSGSSIIVWSDDRNSATSGTDLYAQKMSAAGGAVWQTDGIPVCSQTGTQRIPLTTEIIGDGSGDAIAGWEDNRGADTDIYIQWINSGGNNLTYVPTGVTAPTTPPPATVAGEGGGHSGGCFIDASAAVFVDGYGAVLAALLLAVIFAGALAMKKGS